MSLHVIVAGGGIGGLALAQRLRRDGVAVTVFERERARTDRLQGFRIHIDPHGAAALHECLPPDRFAELVAAGGRGGDEFGFLTERMTRLLHLDADVLTGGDAAPEHRHHGISRITLRQVLLSGLDDVVHHGVAVRGYAHEPDGRVTAHLSDGTSASGDVLVGADGGRSAVREQYLPHARRVDTGIVAIAGKLMLTAGNREWAAPFLAGPRSVIPAGRCGMFLAPHEFTGGVSEAPGTLLDNTRPYVFWSYAARRAAYPVDPAPLDGAGLRDLVLGLVEGWHPLLRRLVAESDADTATLLPIRTSEPVDAWEPTTVTLLGDAIHAMTPFRGVGANTALRDAQGLGRALAAAARGELPLLDAVGSYEAQMREYGFAAVRSSLVAASQAVDGGRVKRSVAKAVFRTVDTVPALKRRMFAGFGS